MTTGTGHPATDLEAEPNGAAPPGPAWKLILVGLVVTFVALAVYDVVSMSSEIGMSPSAAAPGSPSSAGNRSTAASRTTSPSASAAPRPLTISSVTAFGPEGTADGDNSTAAAGLLRGAQPWSSQWYATPAFGNLRPGTGLLLDMGKPVTVTSLRLVLGREPGAAVQVRVGNSAAALDDLSTVASATDLAGAVRLTVSVPVRGEYVLIWFTRLPPDGKGHYQVSVDSPVVDGIVVDGTVVDSTADGTVAGN